MIAVYKLGSRRNDKFSPREVIAFHEGHADAHEGKVLFTTSKGPSAMYRDKIDEILLTTADGKCAMRGEVISNSRFAIMTPDDSYTVPSQFDDEQREKKAWFEIANVKHVDGGIRPGDYTCVTGLDLLTSISGNAFFVYAERNNE